ncbi:MAG: AbrB family transcriptional regulator [Alphaproteobacteria bacterium]|nr:AbrB family transcriptional regulator [Alphaproteobacteria bacterium]
MTFDGAKLSRWALTLALAGLGGWAFYLISFPLPWMMGAMAATTGAALLKLPMTVPQKLRDSVMIILGLMLGTGFSPEVPGRLLDWWPGLLALVLYLIVAVTVGMFWYSRKLGCDAPTAYYAAVPGGLSEMVALAIAEKGDEGMVSILHTLRIMVVAALVPWGIRLAQGLPLTGTPGAVHLTSLALGDFGFLLLGAGLGVVAGRLLRLPAYLMVGPMLASACLSMAGLTQVRPPIELIVLAQVVLGGAVGSRLAWIDRDVVKRGLAASLVLVVPMVALAAALSWVVSELAGFDHFAMLLALMPGGLGEMSLIALALNIDVPFVATHHMTRIALVMLVAPVLFRWIQGRRKG